MRFWHECRSWSDWRGSAPNDTENAMTMAQWVAALDDQIKGVRAKVLVGKGHVTHEEAMAKAEEEFNACRARELRQLESDFDKTMKKFLRADEDNDRA